MPPKIRAIVWCTIALMGLGTAPLQAQRRSSVITAAEIDQVRPTVGTAYDAIRMLRPQWLRSREVVLSGREDDPVQSARLHVHLNDVDVGGVDHLRTIPAERVQELRWLSANEAGSRYGPTDGPAIVVTLKK
jgi:hypothetical protein